MSVKRWLESRATVSDGGAEMALLLAFVLVPSGGVGYWVLTKR